MAERRDIIRDVLATFEGVHVEPNVPARKLANAREHCGVPVWEDVLGLVDLTWFGSAKEAVVFGASRVYVHDRGGLGPLVPFAYDNLSWLDTTLGQLAVADRRMRTAASTIAAVRRAIERVHAESVREPGLVAPAVVPFLAPIEDDVSISPEATALHAAIVAEPGDQGPQLVLADLLLAADDPRGELIVMHHRELAGDLVESEALERYLALAAEYGFPHAFPEPPTLPFVGTSDPVRFELAHQLREYVIAYASYVLVVRVGDSVVLTQQLRTDRGDAWTATETAVILRVISDAIHAGSPFKRLQFPYTDDPLPSYTGCALRVYKVPRDYWEPRGLSPLRFGLAARDYQRWMELWRRLARSLKQARAS